MKTETRSAKTLPRRLRAGLAALALTVFAGGLAAAPAWANGEDWHHDRDAHEQVQHRPDRRDAEARDHDRHDYDGHDHDRRDNDRVYAYAAPSYGPAYGYGYGYAPAPAYRPAPGITFVLPLNLR